MSAQHGEVIGQQLQGNDVHHPLQAVFHHGHANDGGVITRDSGDLIVVLAVGVQLVVQGMFEVTILYTNVWLMG